MIDFCIVTEHPLLITYVDSLQRKNAEALSFYPKCVFERESEKHRIFLGLLNGEPCGYLYMGALGGDVKCHQVCIQYDARRRLYGAHLVAVMEEYAKGSESVTLRCGFDLDANKFWAEMGYKCVAISDGGVRRMRKINTWRKYLEPVLFSDFELRPAEGKTNSTLWRKFKKKGVVTGFNRGRALDEYRASIIKSAQSSNNDGEENNTQQTKGVI